jgi:hypothetical protein
MAKQTLDLFSNLPKMTPAKSTTSKKVSKILVSAIADGDPEDPGYVEPDPPTPIDPIVPVPDVPDTPIPPPLEDAPIAPHQPIFPNEPPSPPGTDPENPEINPLDPRDPSFPKAEEDEDDASMAASSGMSELDMLKNRAGLMNISFSNNIGVDALRGKIQAKLDGETRTETPVMEASQEINNKGVPVKTERQQMIDEEMRLVRIRITNLDPKKKDLPGEIFTVANEILGAVKKYIPYGEATDNGYHVPYIIYRQLREREFLNIKTRKDNRGRTIVETSMAREFALEELPPLTQKELDHLAAAQAAAAGMSN